MKTWKVIIETDNHNCIYLKDQYGHKGCSYKNWPTNECNYENCPKKDKNIFQI